MKRIIYIDDDIPVRSAGAGMPRAVEIIKGLVQLGFQITFVPLQNLVPTKSALERAPAGIRVPDFTRQSFEQFIYSHLPFSECVFVSRPHNMAALAEIRWRRPKVFDGVEVIYDAEALFARREMMKSKITGVQPSMDPNILLERELTFARDADRVTAVSPAELEEFRAAGAPKVDVLAYAVDLSPTSAPFSDRSDFLFVGRMADDDSPNTDSVVWFVTEVLPLIDTLICSASRLILIGEASAPRVRALEGPRVTLVGEVEDLEPWFNQCRVFVAPTRFAAGLPLKVCDAGAAGVPVVATDLVFSQLGWDDRTKLRAGTTTEAFARACVEVYESEAVWSRIRETQLALLAKSFSRSVFEDQLHRVFGS